MPSFVDNFWGDKNNGFEVLYHNMKHGYDSSKEFSDFLRESCSVEESYAKLMAKLAKFASSCGTRGSFSPFWSMLKTLVEKLSNVHQQLVFSWQDLAKDVHRYTDEQHKKHKMMKETEATTSDTVQSIQQIINALHKAKETYHARSAEHEKLKRENASPKEVEKAETKFKKANDDYRSLVEKYSNVRNEFENKMSESCQRFQELEEYHLCQMKDFVDTYAKAWEHHHVLLGQIHEEFRTSNTEMSLEKMLNLFIETKHTGNERPARIELPEGPIEFEESEVSTITSNNTTPEHEMPVIDKPRKEGGDTLSATHNLSSEASGKISPWTVPLRNTGWFLSKRRKEKKKKKKKDEKEKQSEANGKDDAPAVDEEGFSIPPESRLNNDGDRDSWYSSSDSESDPDERTTKIKVEIKPVDQNGSGLSGGSNVDTLLNIVEGLRLSPGASRKNPSTSDMKKSNSLSETLSSSSLKSADPFGLLSSNASSPTDAANFSSPSNAHNHSHTSTSSHNFSFSDLSTGGSPGSLRGSHSTSTTSNTTTHNNPTTATTNPLPATARSQTPLAGAPLLPGPPPPRTRSTHPSSTTATARPPGRVSPAPGMMMTGGGSGSASMERTDSLPSLDKVSFHSNPYSLSSRGPSPLTIGASDTIPLAVAFSETANAMFRGTDTASCKVKLTGDVMVSFPAGIVRVLMDNPSPATLSFSLKNTHKLQHILVNKQLVTEDGSQSGASSKSYSFVMPALAEHLRAQAEHNNKASYFNIDILKYQIDPGSGSQHTPLQLMSYWKCEGGGADFRLDYSYNSTSLASKLPLTNVTVLLPLSGARVSNAQMQPNAQWCADTKRVTWRLGEISPLNTQGQGSLRGKFDVEGGGVTPSTAAVQFLCEGTTMSGLDFELNGPGYRVSLIKKRLVTGKYVCEADTEVKMV